MKNRFALDGEKGKSPVPACSVTMLAALLLFISGLILSTLQEKDKRDFEFQLQQVANRYHQLNETANEKKASA